MIGRGFLTSVIYEDPPPYIAYPHPFFKYCSTLHHPPLVFLLPCFFEEMDDCAKSDVLFVTQ